MLNNITVALSEDIPALSNLYATAFNAGANECERFFDMRFIPENTLVFRRNDEILAALYLWYGEVVCAGKRYPADYIYAAATCADMRNQGIMAQLIDAAAELSLTRGRHFLVLSPANEKLYEYYGTHGFKTAFYQKELTLKRNVLSLIADKKSEDFVVLSAGDIYTLRETLFIRDDGFSWDSAALEYANAYLTDGGKLITLSYGDKPCAYAFIDGNVVLECVTTSSDFPALVAKILQASPADSFRFMLPPNFPLSADGFVLRPAGMLRPLTDDSNDIANQLRNAYLGLTLA